MQQQKKIKIIVDTREQDPLRFADYEVETCRDKLDAGDYTIFSHDRPKDDHSIIIERKKNCQELIGNFGTKWDTFRAELELLGEYKHRAIVVCGPNNFPYLYERGFTALHPSFIYSRIAEVTMEYQIPILFAGTREDAENIIYRLFTRAIRLNDE